jgi:Domain of unknown function (DUF4802)
LPFQLILVYSSSSLTYTTFPLRAKVFEIRKNSASERKSIKRGLILSGVGMGDCGCRSSNIFLSFLIFISRSSQKLQTKQKSSNKLYCEAAQMLGMSCEFTENCRCLDCQVSELIEILMKFSQLDIAFHFFQPSQSRYFDCDDDDDSDTFSNLSSVIETEEFSTRAENGETLYYCNGEDGFCSFQNGACENAEEE